MNAKWTVSAVVVMVMLVAASWVHAADAPADTSKTDAAEKLFKEGRAKLFTGDYAGAMVLLRQAAALDATKTSYRLHLARACRYAGRTDEARTLLEGILKTDPEHVEAGQMLAGLYADAKRWQDVVGVLEPLLRYRHDYTTYHLLAEAEYHLDRPKQARKHFEEAIKQNPKSGEDHVQLGNLYLAGSFFALAAERYESALALGIDDPVLRYKLASAYFNLRNTFGKIETVTVRAGKVDTISAEWYLIETVPGETDVFRAAPRNSAVYQVTKVLASGVKDRPDVHLLRANIFLAAGRYKRAYAMFGEIEKTIPEPDRPLFYYYYAQAALGVGKYDEYLEHLDQAIALDEKTYGSMRTDAFVKVAEQYNQQGNAVKYIEYLSKAVTLKPESASLHLKLGHAWADAREHARAARQWRMVLDLEPDHPQRLELMNLIRDAERRAAGPAKT
ncbi:MAG TPA: tetratricopeptide repeat protein [Planctomycetota bacterium]|nr:tetratricopeptide repeat protein [Planctomycetota bacterium]